MLNFSQNYISNSKRASRFGTLVLILLPSLLAFFLPRWVGHDVPNLGRPWQPVSQGPSNATAFLGAPLDIRFHLNGAYIGTAEGQVYEMSSRLKLVDNVPEANRQQILALHQERRPLIPYIFIKPPGEIVDYYESTAVHGSLLDTGPSHFVILTDGTIWNWTSGSPSYELTGFKYLGLIYMGLTLVTAFVLLKLPRLWPGTWFWVPTVSRKWELVVRVGLSAVAALVPGAIIFGLFSLPFLENYWIFLAAMALLTTLFAVPSVALIKKQYVALLLSVIVPLGILIEDEVSRLLTYRNWGLFDWTLLVLLLIVGMLTVLAVKMLVAFFRKTGEGSPPGLANSIMTFIR